MYRVLYASHFVSSSSFSIDFCFSHLTCPAHTKLAPCPGLLPSLLCCVLTPLVGKPRLEIKDLFLLVSVSHISLIPLTLNLLCVQVCSLSCVVVHLWRFLTPLVGTPRFSLSLVSLSTCVVTPLVGTPRSFVFNMFFFLRPVSIQML